MMTEPRTLRAQARALSDHERERRHATCHFASDSALLRAVVSIGVAGGEWSSTSDCAARSLVVDDRTLRRWLADDYVDLPAPVRDKLEVLAFAFGVEVAS